MCRRSIAGYILITIIVVAGCAKRQFVNYSQVEETNWVEVNLVSGKKVSGIVYKIEPHQLSMVQEDNTKRIVAKPSIKFIKRKPPVYDEFGNGISEYEIKSEQTNKNTIIYGIGGGGLSLGVSFFVGSLASKNASSGGQILAAATFTGGGIGTYFFVKAGKSKDRSESIERILERRRSVEIKGTRVKNKTTSKLQEQLEEEKKKQEELRKQREKLLRELEQKKDK